MSNDLESIIQPSFLSLPRELRDLVYLHLVNDTRQPPNDPDHAGDREFHSKIYFEARSPRPVLLQLKLCCKQICAEVNDTLSKHASDYPRPAKLDIMVRGETGDRIAAFLQENRAELGIEYLIWQQQIWRPATSAGWRPMSNRGGDTANHFDHVHVTTVGNAATG